MEVDFQRPAALKALNSLDGITSRMARALVQKEEAQILEELANKIDYFLRAYHEEEKIVTEHVKAGIEMIGYFDDAYPKQLKEIASPPNILYLKGPAGLLQENHLVAVVGTRQPTSFGVSATKTITSALAKEDFVTVSGLALGIDGICHRTSLEEKIPTIAILGSGLDYITPAQHRSLAEEILSEGGCLLSEYPLKTPVKGYQLVARDRLQSGLAQAVIIGQTPIKSGTMYTARFAAEQKKAVYCPVPLSQNSQSEGNRVLLEVPASELDQHLPAFSGQQNKLKYLGQQPLAKPITRDNIKSVISEIKVL